MWVCLTSYWFPKNGKASGPTSLVCLDDKLLLLCQCFKVILSICVCFNNITSVQMSWEWALSEKDRWIQPIKDKSSSSFLEPVGSAKVQFIPSRWNPRPEICLRGNLLSFARELAWCINIVSNMPIHHQAARGFWVCSDQICSQRWWGACWFCCRKVQIQLFVTSSFLRGGREDEIQGIEIDGVEGESLGNLFS